MTERIFSSPTPLSQVPLQGAERLDADPKPHGQLSPNPLLQSGTFIDVCENRGVKEVTAPRLRPEAVSTDPTTATAADAADVTPLSRRQGKKLPQELVEKPSWLPDDWRVEVRVRTSGATAGTTDRYYFSPSGDKLRSKKEVLHYLDTGSKPNKKLRSDDGASASGNPSGHKQKKPKANMKDLSGLNFDFKNPPQAVDYSLTDEGNFVASVDNITVPESQKADWDAVFSHVTELDRSSGAS